MHRGSENSWRHDWQDLLTQRPTIDWIGNPDAVSMDPFRVDVFARSSSNQLWHMWHISPP